MVLYEKNGNFVGIGKEELSFLGFEDFEEFKSEHKDFADLFVNKPGYIFKFKNFSWIDYTLHSGAPKKAVIVKLKNGQEVETGIKISEIFLMNAQKENEFYYSIELSQNTMQMQQTPQTLVTNEFEQNSIAFESPEPESPAKNTPQSINIEEDYSQDMPQETPLIKEENSFSTPSLEEDYTSSFESSSIKEDSSNDFKLKIEEDVYEEPQKLKIDLDFDETKENDDKNTISFDSDIEDFTEEVSEVDEESFVSDYEEKDEPEIALKVFDEPIVSEETSPIIKEHSEELVEVEKIDFDLAHCAEETGLDLGDIAHLLEEYLKDIEASEDQIENAISNNDAQALASLIIPLKGVSDNLRIDDLSKVYEKMLSSSKEEQNVAFKAFANFVSDLKSELI